MKIIKYLIDRFSVYLQTFLWLLGYSWHNPIRDECTPDFSCCVPECKEKFAERLKSLPKMLQNSWEYRRYLIKERRL